MSETRCYCHSCCSTFTAICPVCKDGGYTMAEIEVPASLRDDMHKFCEAKLQTDLDSLSPSDLVARRCFLEELISTCRMELQDVTRREPPTQRMPEWLQ